MGETPRTAGSLHMGRYQADADQPRTSWPEAAPGRNGALCPGIITEPESMVRVAEATTGISYATTRRDYGTRATEVL
jgi:hypothetical protein